MASPASPMHASSVGVLDVWSTKALVKQSLPSFRVSSRVGLVQCISGRKMVVFGSASIGGSKRDNSPWCWRGGAAIRVGSVGGGRYVASEVAPIKKLSGHGSKVFVAVNGKGDQNMFLLPERSCC